MKISVSKINSESDMKEAFSIREKVFVIEQKVAPEDEYDEYEQTSFHFIAKDQNGKACGTARWRFIEKKGIKLERFAVLESHRGMGIGSSLVQAVLTDIQKNPQAANQLMYMHAQLDAIPLYTRFGFEKEGTQFEECGIQHYKMIKMNKA